MKNHGACGLTACTLGSAPGPTLGNEYRETLPFLHGSAKTLGGGSILGSRYSVYSAVVMGGLVRDSLF